jgi:hypothetical protein
LFSTCSWMLCKISLMPALPVDEKPHFSLF